MNGYTPFEIKTRDCIQQLIKEKQFLVAKETSLKFISANKKRSKKRRFLLQHTCKLWVTIMNGIHDSWTEDATGRMIKQ